MSRDDYERTTVYLTATNKKRLAALNCIERKRLINQAVEVIFAKAETSRAAEDFAVLAGNIQPVDPIVSSEEAVARARSGRG